MNCKIYKIKLYINYDILHFNKILFKKKFLIFLKNIFYKIKEYIAQKNLKNLKLDNLMIIRKILKL